LADAGLVSAAAEARTLCAHAARVNPGQLMLLDRLDAAELDRLHRLVAERLTGRPLQHVTGVAPFRTTTLAVGPGVFIPRPETEVVVGWVLDRLAARPQADPPALVVDLCAGSGAISRALALEAPGLRQWAVEVDPTAAAYLRRNLADTSVTVVEADITGVLPDLEGQIDVVVANPPYIPDAAWADLPPEVRDHDPVGALVSGPDGLAATRLVAAQAARLLRPGGVVASEHDDTQGLSAPAVFTEVNWADVADHLDWAGRPRYVTATCRGTRR
jgi:release factor glutamine methyltransferase